VKDAVEDLSEWVLPRAPARVRQGHMQRETRKLSITQIGGIGASWHISRHRTGAPPTSKALTHPTYDARTEIINAGESSAAAFWPAERRSNHHRMAQ
ncbi:MAG TPA: hypothetical protein VGW38_21905, partial [Chloroflexota bacterium]|nr:hypothetical protein [Chloroflexota bacterium]